MGFFDLFKKKREVHDPVLGTLTYKDSFWRGRVMFRPAGVEIELLIYADEIAPERYTDLYRKIEARYTQLKPEIEARLLVYMRTFQPELVVADFDKEFTISEITIDDLDVKPHECDISYTTVHDEMHTFSILLKDMVLQPEVSHH